MKGMQSNQYILHCSCEKTQSMSKCNTREKIIERERMQLVHISSALVKIQVEFGLTEEACLVHSPLWCNGQRFLYGSIAWEWPRCPLLESSKSSSKQVENKTKKSKGRFQAALGFTWWTEFHHLQDLNMAGLCENL